METVNFSEAWGEVVSLQDLVSTGCTSKMGIAKNDEPWTKGWHTNEQANFRANKKNLQPPGRPPPPPRAKQSGEDKLSAMFPLWRAAFSQRYIIRKRSSTSVSALPSSEPPEPIFSKGGEDDEETHEMPGP